MPQLLHKWGVFGVSLNPQQRCLHSQGRHYHPSSFLREKACSPGPEGSNQLKNICITDAIDNRVRNMLYYLCRRRWLSWSCWLVVAVYPSLAAVNLSVPGSHIICNNCSVHTWLPEFKVPREEKHKNCSHTIRNNCSDRLKNCWFPGEKHETGTQIRQYV